MLPSPEEATVVFAQVTSFVDYWATQAGEDALPKLVAAIREAPQQVDVNDAVTRVSGTDLREWERRWREQLGRTKHELPAELRPGALPPYARQLGRHVRLAELLLERGHADVAAAQLEQALVLAPTLPIVRCVLASAYIEHGDYADAAVLVERISDVHHNSARWWSLHDLLFDDPPEARARALSLDPLHPAVACDELLPPSLPSDDLRRALCQSARRWPR